jgi:hypothetical protein
MDLEDRREGRAVLAPGSRPLVAAQEHSADPVPVDEAAGLSPEVRIGDPVALADLEWTASRFGERQPRKSWRF